VGSWTSKPQPGHCKAWGGATSWGWVSTREQLGPMGGDVHCGCLQAGQYTSVFVDNGSGAALTVQSSSSFSGLLLGP